LQTTVNLEGVCPRLAEIYGPRAWHVSEFIRDRAGGAVPVFSGAEIRVGEIIYAVEHEKARTLGDIMLRRTGLAFDPAHDPSWPRRVLEIATGAEVATVTESWKSIDPDRALADYQAERNAFLVGSASERGAKPA
jgi:glycerol-3-phosphate dehydrogenase